MDDYTDFIMTVRFPPNPFRLPNDTMPNSITVPEQTGGTTLGFPNAGQTAFINDPLDLGVFTCNQCHSLPTGTTTNLFNGNAEGESQDFKIPHLRNMYEKVGFGVIRPGLLSGDPNNIGTTTQRSGFGFIHDGSVSLTEFLAADVFQSNDQQEEDLFAFMLAFPTETAPAVGVQVTLNFSNKNDGTLVSLINTLITQAEGAKCDVVVKGVVGGDAKGYVYDRVGNNFVPDALVGGPLTEAALRATIASGDVLTYTGVPPGAGVRMGIDRDRDTFLDQTEETFSTDPADPNSNPWGF
jgi:hypothetical protein